MTAIVVTPLALLGGVFYAARTLDEPWSTLTRLDPIYYLVDVTRSVITGFSESAVGVSLAVAALASSAGRKRRRRTVPGLSLRSAVFARRLSGEL